MSGTEDRFEDRPSLVELLAEVADALDDLGYDMYPQTIRDAMIAIERNAVVCPYCDAGREHLR